jgi:hypothetical protein
MLSGCPLREQLWGGAVEGREAEALHAYLARAGRHLEDRGAG